MAGPRVEALAREVRKTDRELAGRITSACEQDTHDQFHQEHNEGCVFCHAETEADLEEPDDETDGDPGDRGSAYAGSYALSAASDGYIG